MDNAIENELLSIVEQVKAKGKISEEDLTAKLDNFELVPEDMKEIIDFVEDKGIKVELLEEVIVKDEDLKDITEDKDIQNIIVLREYIKNHNTIEYFNYTQTKKGEEET